MGRPAPRLAAGPGSATGSQPTRSPARGSFEIRDAAATDRFFELGPQCTVAFFEYADSTVEPFTKAAGVPDPRAGQFDHLALNLPDEDALIALQQRLRSADCEVTYIVDHGSVHSVYFSDPNGTALEASWWVFDATGRAADYGDDRFFADPNRFRPSTSSEPPAASPPFQAPDSRRPSPS